MAYGQVPSPAGLGRSGASALTSLRSARPAARPPGAPCTGGRWARSLCGAGSPGQLEEGRRAPAKCSSGAASLNPPSYPWSGTRLNPFHRREAQRPAQPPKVTQPGSYPAAADFKTFLPRRIAKPTTFRCGARTRAERARALALPGACSAPGGESQNPAPSRVCSPRRGLLSNSEGAGAQRPRHLLSIVSACKAAGGVPI